MNHNDYVFEVVDDRLVFKREFDLMYRNCPDPHEQSKQLDRLDYQHAFGVLERLVFIRRGIREKVAILDVGCGLGYFTAHMKERFPEVQVDGADVSARAVERARERCAGSRFFTLDLKQDLPPEAGRYDVVTALSVLYYFTEAEIVRVLDNLRRLILPGGFLLATCHLPEDMKFGRYIQSFEDASRLFAMHGFEAVYGLDIHNRLDVIYDGSDVGRQLCFVVRQGDMSQESG